MTMNYLMEATLAEGKNIYNVDSSYNAIYGFSQYSYAFRNCRYQVVTVNFGKDSELTTIDQYSFYECLRLETVNIENCKKLKTIGKSAFKGCSSLKSITFPDSVTSISESLFKSCTDLGTVIFKGTFDTIPKYCLCDCNNLNSVTLSGSIKTIDEKAFYYCEKLESVTLPSSLRTIGVNAFKTCKMMNTCEIQEGLEYINFGAFSQCYKLTTINIPSTLINISDEVFYQCESLKTVNLATTVKFKSYGELTFYNTSIESIRIPFSVDLIGTSAFALTFKLKKFDVDQNHAIFKAIDGVLYKGRELYHYPNAKGNKYALPSTTEYIGIGAFNCSNITSVTFTNTNIKEIKEGAFSYCNYITELVLPTNSQGTYTIGETAFEHSNAIKSITISKSVEKIGNFAFRYCESLTTLNFAKDCVITSIGINAFWFCKKLLAVELPDSLSSVGEGPFQYCEKLNSVTFGKGLTYLSEKMFAGTSIQSITINEGVTSIGSYCFEDCTLLKTVHLPKTIELLGSAIFLNCPSDIQVTFADGAKFAIIDKIFLVNADKTKLLQCLNKNVVTVTLPSSLTSIESSVFRGYSELTTVNFKNNDPALQTIEYGAFENCKKLKNFQYCPHLTTFGNSVFSGSGIGSLEFCKNVKTIEQNTFAECNSLVTICELPQLKTIDFYGFRSCQNIKTIGAMNNLIELLSGAFSNNNKLESFPLCTKLTKIESGAFENCHKLKSFTFGEKITSIEDSAFRNCYSLEKIEFKAAVESSLTIGKSAFHDCYSLHTVNIDTKANIIKIGPKAFNSAGLSTFHIPSSLTEIADAAFYNSTVKTITSEENGKLEKILPKCFENCTDLTSVTLPNSVIEIGELAFNETSISAFTLPTSTKTVGDSTFLNCKKLVKFTIPDGSKLEKLGYKLFFGCSSLKDITNNSPNFKVHETALFNANMNNMIVFPPASLTAHFHMPKETKWIMPYAFFSCDNLVTVTFQKSSIESIDFGAFDSCVNLIKVNIPASLTKVGDNAFINCPKLQCGLDIEVPSDEMIDMLVNKGKMPEYAALPCSFTEKPILRPKIIETVLQLIFVVFLAF